MRWRWDDFEGGIAFAGGVALGLTLGLLLSSPAPAQTTDVERLGLVCDDPGEVDRQLRTLGEVPAWRGLDAHGRLRVLYQDPRGGWTLLAQIPGGPACVVGYGGGGQALVAPVAPVAGDGA